jgi:hypothetical protein
VYGRGAKFGRGPWKKPRKGKLGRIPGPAPLPNTDPPDPQGPFRVQGQRASDLEARTYRALKKLGWRDEQIDFQFPIRGGRNPGGQTLDFVVEGYGRTVVLAVDGDYWHNRTLQQIEDDRQKQADALAWFRHPIQYLKLNSGDLVDDAMAERRLLREVGRGG